MFSTIISPTELNAHLLHTDWVIVDCRFSLADKDQGRREYETAHIPGAHYAHLDTALSGEIIAGRTGRHPLPSVEKAEQIFSGWGIGPATQVVAYDHGHGGVAARLWWLLNWLGHSAVAVLDGGWTAWQAADFPQDHAVPEPTDGPEFVARPDNARVATLDDVVAMSEQKSAALFDSRAAARYRGDEEPIDPVPGHIPAAISAPFPDNLADGRFLPPDQLAARFRMLLGDLSAEDAVFYCGSGVTACHNLLALQHAGLGVARLYPGSWSEWITDPARPVARSAGDR